MSNEQTPEELFLEQLQQALLASQPIKPKELEYRVYYDSSGNVVTYTTEDLPGDYIVITREQYNLARHDAKVKDGKLHLVHLLNTVLKIAKTESGVWRTNAHDVSVVADEDDTDSETVRCSFVTYQEQST
jgi:hypothetical protein